MYFMHAFCTMMQVFYLSSFACLESIFDLNSPLYACYLGICPIGHSSSSEYGVTNICAIFMLLLDAVKQVLLFVGMQPCERSDKVNATSSSHTLLLAGVFRGGHDVLVRARFAEGQNVTTKITVRSRSLTVCEIVAASLS